MINNEKLIPNKNPRGIGVVTTVFYGKVNRKVLKAGNILKERYQMTKKDLNERKRIKMQRKEENGIETNDQELKNPLRKKVQVFLKSEYLDGFRTSLARFF